MAKHGGKRKGAGRPPGKRSKKTLQWKELGRKVTGELTDKFFQEIMTLDGKDYVDAYAKILEYFQPKLSRSEVKNEGAQELIIRHKIGGKKSNE